MSENIKEQESKSTNDDEKTKESLSCPRILLADKMGPFVEETLKKNGCEVVWDASLNGDSLKEEMSKFQPNVIVVRSTKITKEHLLASSSLALVVRAGYFLIIFAIHKSPFIINIEISKNISVISVSVLSFILNILLYCWCYL